METAGRRFSRPFPQRSALLGHRRLQAACRAGGGETQAGRVMLGTCGEVLSASGDAGDERAPTVLVDICCPYRGQGIAIHGRHIQSRWEPIVAFAKPPVKPALNWLSDMIEGGGGDKQHHAWGKHQSEVAYLIERLTEPGQFVVDPFCGGGTIPAACKATGRRWLATEKDKTTALVARKRLGWHHLRASATSQPTSRLVGHDSPGIQAVHQASPTTAKRSPRQGTTWAIEKTSFRGGAKLLFVYASRSHRRRQHRAATR